MAAREISCCFTGHRPKGLPWGGNEDDPRCQKLKEELEATLEGLYQSGYRHFICGMAIGCDMYFAEAVIKLREAHPDVTLEAAIPCGGQPDRWAATQRRRYNTLLDGSNKVTVLQIAYTPDCMQRRNRYMVDHSSFLLAVYNGYPGGTQNTILYAQRQAVQTLIIDL